MLVAEEWWKLRFDLKVGTLQSPDSRTQLERTIFSLWTSSVVFVLILCLSSSFQCHLIHLLYLICIRKAQYILFPFYKIDKNGWILALPDRYNHHVVLPNSICVCFVLVTVTGRCHIIYYVSINGIPSFIHKSENYKWFYFPVTKLHFATSTIIICFVKPWDLGKWFPYYR